MIVLSGRYQFVLSNPRCSWDPGFSDSILPMNFPHWASHGKNRRNLRRVKLGVARDSAPGDSCLTTLSGRYMVDKIEFLLHLLTAYWKIPGDMH
ncbi:hypothetical protein AVEN_32752-1 [Araneus ventricosus]|uniref:Uncharacterized protein n=1 Tax=Araneus ventricosus TaxID=182803 RepID=A0A4Y2CWH2_ARAVE|nr:hypothetical protein AVEN_32752-1 [Araneus ventricosus]